MTIGHEPNWREVWKTLQAGPLLEGQPAGYVHAAQVLSSRGRRAEAAAALQEALRVDPNHLPALRALASLAQSQGAPALAAELRQRVVAIELAGLSLEGKAQAEAMAFRQAMAGDAPPPERVPASYLAARYDAWADDFEHDLRERLHYRGPEMLHAAIARVREPAPATSRARPGLRHRAHGAAGAALGPPAARRRSVTEDAGARRPPRAL